MKVAKGHVVSQSRRAGQVLVPDAKINIVVSRGRRL
jgi:beta-lactam-binding protein with PASTA domain